MRQTHKSLASLICSKETRRFLGIIAAPVVRLRAAGLAVPSSALHVVLHDDGAGERRDARGSPWIPTRRSHGMSVARTLSGNTVFSCVTNPFTFNKLEAGGVERYAPTDNTQLIEKVRTQEPHNPLYARLLCTKSCTRNLKAE